MATQDKIRDEKLKLIIINSIAAMILTASRPSSEKIDKY